MCIYIYIHIYIYIYTYMYIYIYIYIVAADLEPQAGGLGGRLYAILE